MKKFAIIVAGGQGIRMQGNLPKQFLPLGEEPVLAHTLRRFALPDIRIILVMNPSYLDYWKELSAPIHDLPEHTVIPGGTTRALSVLNGLNAIEEDGWVAIHDAVRPLCSRNLIHRLFQEATDHGSAIPVVPVKDTLRLLTPEGSTTVSRDQYRAVQTPQVFHLGHLRKAFQLEDVSGYTDEASLFQAAGHPIHLSEGEEQNIKITVPSDLITAASLLAKNKEN